MESFDLSQILREGELLLSRESQEFEVVGGSSRLAEQQQQLTKVSSKEPAKSSSLSFLVSGGKRSSRTI